MRVSELGSRGRKHRGEARFFWLRFNQRGRAVNKLLRQRAQLCDGRFFYFEKSFVFGEIPFLVGGVQHAPLRRRPIQGVGEALKYDVAVFAAVTVPA